MRSRLSYLARAGLATAAAVAVVTSVLVARTTAPASSTVQQENMSSQLATDLAAVQRSGDVVGLLARVDDNGRVVQARRGTARLGTREPVPWDAEFRIASTTKTFVATVALQLVHEGVLSLDDTVDRWLPGLVRGHGNDGRRITVRELLAQRSGLFNYVEDPALQQAFVGNIQKYRYDNTPAVDWVKLAVRHRPSFPPGSRWQYSNTNYVLTALIIQAATGLDWASQVEHRIIVPLRLRHTYASAANPFLLGPHAHSYAWLPGHSSPIDLTDNSLGHDGDAGLVSTTADIDTFARALITGRLLPHRYLRLMQTTTVADDPYFPGGRYGLGLRYEPLSCGGGYWGHEGDDPGGFHTRMFVSGDGTRSVVVSTTGALTVRTGRALNTLVDHAFCAAG